MTPTSPPKPITFPYKVHNDTELIKWFQENADNIEFIKYTPNIDNYARSKNLLKDIKDLKQKPLHEQKKELLKIWKNLIGNAIVYLKSQDTREEYHDDEDYGVDKLHNFFESFSNFESLFYGRMSITRSRISYV